MKTLLLFSTAGFIALGLSACSGSLPKRTKYSDKNMRVMIDPSQIDKDGYVKLQKALVESGAFTVVDRAAGFEAIKKEQNRQHRDSEERIALKERWSHWGKFYGVGSVLVPHNECTRVTSGGFLKPGPRMRCFQYISIVDANTGEVVVMVENEEVGERMENIYGNNYHTPEWDGTVEKLIDAYPKKFEAQAYHPVLENYRNLSEEEAIRQKEKVAPRKPASVEEGSTE